MDRKAERANAHLVLDAFGLGDSIAVATTAPEESEDGWQVAVRLPGHLDFDFALRADGVWVVAPTNAAYAVPPFWSDPKGVEFPTLQQAIVHRLYHDSVTE